MAAEIVGPLWMAHEQARPGQAEMMQHIIAALKAEGHHLAAAPTGIGKTAASLAGCLHHTRDVEIDSAPIMFLTGRQSQHRIVVETVRSINERIPAGKAKVGLVDLIGQAGMCIQPIATESKALFSRLCAGMRADRSCKPWMATAPSISEKILAKPLHVEELVELARNHSETGRKCQICPWKAARETAKYADIIVCDYNHIFNDDVREATLSAMGISLDEVIIVVDEAHNLPARIRRGLERKLSPEMVRNAQFEMEEYSGILSETEGADTSHLIWATEVLKTLRKEMTPWFRNMYSRLDALEVQPKQKKTTEMKIESEELIQVLNDSMQAVDGRGVQMKLGEVSKPSSSKRGFVDLCASLMSVEIEVDDSDEDSERELACHRLVALLEVFHRHGESAALVLRFDSSGNSGTISTHLLDAGVVSGPIFKKAKGSVLMSGTLHPPKMFADLLSLPTNKTTMETYESPFLSEKRPVAIANDVTTKWKGRGTENTKRIQSHIEALIEASPGHVAVFAPSYAQLQEYVGEHRWRVSRVIHEDSSWSKSRADKLLQDLERERESGRKVLLAGVFGGRLSEGIDYHQNLLTAVACIGIPMAPPSVVSDALKDYYASRFGKDLSWRYATTQPAVNSVLQAMGRPIRAMGDRAFILLLDQRLTTWTYKKCLPSNISPLICADSQMTSSYAKRFFKRNP
ncbi:MAG TPA: ATP-dependent DNA helicase [Candidatus Poseidoniales archaeon]|nr:MAG: hypothetical protein CXT68_00805 [Euryarchaeota archaeon]HIF16473.1 ATP-dependent DNA helicase [Candidatus Poseidoniales archaeon]